MINKKLKVMFVVHSLDVGGTEKLIYEMAEAISEHNIEPMVACLDQLGVWGERLRTKGFKVFELGRKPGVDMEVASRLRELIKKEIPDVINPHQYAPYFYTITAVMFMRNRPKVVFTEHGRFYPDKVRLKRVLFNQIAKLITDEIIGVSEFSKRALVKYEWFPERRIKVIYNGIKTEKFAGEIDIVKKKSVGLSADDLVIGSVGRLCAEKNYPMLIRAAELVCKKAPKARFVIVGGGELEKELKAQAIELGVSGKVLFLGTREDIPDIMKTFDVFAMSSDSEGASLVLLEAMMSGLPVVATDVGGNAELVEDGKTGILVPKGDHVRFSDMILKLLDDAAGKKRLGKAGMKRVAERFSFRGMVENYAGVFNKWNPS